MSVYSQEHVDCVNVRSEGSIVNTKSFARFIFFFFFFNDTATTEIYTLSLHDALPISLGLGQAERPVRAQRAHLEGLDGQLRSEEHTSELQSQLNLVCRLLLEKKKKNSVFQRARDLRLPDQIISSLRPICTRRHFAAPA